MTMSCSETPDQQHLFDDGGTCTACNTRRPAVVEMTLMPLLGGRKEQVLLGGVDISNHVKSVNITGDPGELLNIQLTISPLNRGHTGVYLPEQFANVTVIDTGEMLHMRELMFEALIMFDRLLESRIDGDPEALPMLRQRMQAMVDGPESGESLSAYRRRTKRG